MSGLQTFDRCEAPTTIDVSSEGPILCRGGAEDWDCKTFTKEILVGSLSATETCFRAAPISSNTTREYESVFIESTFREFCDWLVGESDRLRAPGHAFGSLPSRRSDVLSLYSDYSYFRELFSDLPSIPKFGKWAELLTDKAGICCLPTDDTVQNELTLWVSSKGACTPIHYDSYGCNAICQVAGSKRWRIWKPSSQPPAVTLSTNKNKEAGEVDAAETTTVTTDSPTISSAAEAATEEERDISAHNDLEKRSDEKSAEINNSCKNESKSENTFEDVDGVGININAKNANNNTTSGMATIRPLRIPYEESSIYSLYDPRKDIHNACPPYMDIELHAGDILFLPKHYWHFVETTGDYAISVNLWLPLKGDSKERLTEAATRFVFGSVKEALTHCGVNAGDPKLGWLSPSEADGTLNFVVGQEEEEGQDGNKDGVGGHDYHRHSGNVDENKLLGTGEEQEEGDEDDGNLLFNINKRRGDRNGAGADHTTHLGYMLTALQEYLAEVRVDTTGRVPVLAGAKGQFADDLCREFRDAESSTSSTEKQEDQCQVSTKSSEKFLKRFVSAMLSPENIEKCLASALIDSNHNDDSDVNEACDDVVS